MSTRGVDLELRDKVTESANLVGQRLDELERWGKVCGVLNLVAAGVAALLGTVVYPRMANGDAVAITAGVFSLAAFIAAGLQKQRVEPFLERFRAGAVKLDELRLLIGRSLDDDEAEARLVAILGSLPPLRRGPLPIEAARGSIVSPAASAAVEAHFRARGTVRDVDPKRVHVWLTVDVGGKIWPKSGRIAVGGEAWEQPVHHTNPGPFGLTLWAVNARADRRLREWLDGGAEKVSYDGIAPLPGMKFLDHVEGLHVASAVPAGGRSRW